jgi:hypothetical protein
VNPGNLKAAVITTATVLATIWLARQYGPTRDIVNKALGINAAAGIPSNVATTT